MSKQKHTEELGEVPAELKPAYKINPQINGGIT